MHAILQRKRDHSRDRTLARQALSDSIHPLRGFHSSRVVKRPRHSTLIPAVPAKRADKGEETVSLPAVACLTVVKALGSSVNWLMVRSHPGMHT